MVNYHEQDFTFSFKNRSYRVKFNGFNICLIEGDSSTGKSLMCNDLRTLSAVDKKLSNVLVIDCVSNNIGLLKLKETYTHCNLIFIDNADILVTQEISDIIASHMDTFWVLIGRRIPSCVLSLTCVCELRHKNNLFYTEYDRFN